MKKLLPLFLVICLLTTPILATDFTDAMEQTAAHLLETTPNPQVGSTGGDWVVLGLARSGVDVPQTYWDGYYQEVVNHVVACQGVLHEKKYTEYARVILSLGAMGADPTQVGGYNLLTPLGDYENTLWQGINGPIWALIALDSGNYAMPVNATAQTQATRQLYVQYILDHQLPDGGWRLAGTGASEADITGMALQALANYQSQDAVAIAIETALACVSQLQDTQGGFSNWGESSVESTVQILVGLTALGVDLDDPAFVKNGHTVLDNLLTYRQENGAFIHTLTSVGESQMSTEQGSYAMVAAMRAQNGENSLYAMGDVTLCVTGVAVATLGLANKHADVTAVAVTDETIAFSDISTSPYATAILDLASRGILSGYGDGRFAPEDTLTRGAFAKLVVNALGLPLISVSQFTDVPTSHWSAAYVGTAYTYGIVQGTSDTTFAPAATITRQQAAVMVTRAAKLCGLDTDLNDTATRDVLAGFLDYVTVSPYAQSSLAFCYDQGILDDAALEILPTQAMTRGEVAQMLYNLLAVAKLV